MKIFIMIEHIKSFPKIQESLKSEFSTMSYGFLKFRETSLRQVLWQPIPKTTSQREKLYVSGNLEI